MKNQKKLNYALFLLLTIFIVASFPSFAGDIIQVRQLRFKQSAEALQTMFKHDAPAENYQALKQKEALSNFNF